MGPGCGAFPRKQGRGRMGCGVSRVGGSSRGGFPRGQAGIRSPRLLLLAPSSPASNSSNPQPKATGLHRCRVSRARSHGSPAVTSAGRLPRGTGTMEPGGGIGVPREAVRSHTRSTQHAATPWRQDEQGHGTNPPHKHCASSSHGTHPPHGCRRNWDMAHNHPTRALCPHPTARIHPMNTEGPLTQHTTTPQAQCAPIP